MRSFLRAVLSVSTGGAMEYAEAGNGEEALKILGAFQPDVIVADLLRGIKDAIENFKPFVRNRDYFGADRRNGKKPYSGDDRRTSAPVLVSPPEDKVPQGERRWKRFDRAS